MVKRSIMMIQVLWFLNKKGSFLFFCIHIYSTILVTYYQPQLRDNEENPW